MLTNESFKVSYKTENEKGSDRKFFKNLGCFKLNEIEFYSNKNETNLDELNDKLHEFFNKLKWDEFAVIAGINSSFLDLIKFRKYLIVHNQICLIDNWQLLHFLYSSAKTWIENNKIFARIETYKIFAFNDESFDLYESSAKAKEIFDTRVVLHEEYPYSECTRKSDFRAKCLNKCFRKQRRSSKYLFSGNETGTIYLNEALASTEEREAKCLKKCKAKDCKLVYFISPRKNNRPETITYTASPLISRFTYLTQFIGLICLVLNICETPGGRVVPIVLDKNYLDYATFGNPVAQR